MFVNKYKIVDSELSGTTAYTINIGASQNGGFVGQQEIVDTKFVELEVDKAVNIIYDYEKVKVFPKWVNTLSTKVNYIVNISGNTTSGFYSPTYWGDLGLNADEKFDLNDFKFKKKAFTQSFLRLDFYDSDIATNQNFVTFMTLYPKFSHAEVAAAGIGNVPDPNTYLLGFQLGNTIIDRTQNGEGFALFYFKDEILPAPLPPKYLYMKATFNNAKDGRVIGLMSSSTQNLSIDDLMKTTIATTPIIKNNLYTRYILTRNNTAPLNGYYYEIDWRYSTNVQIGNGTGTLGAFGDWTVNLYQIDAK